MACKDKKAAKKLEELQSSMGPLGSSSNQGQVDGNMITGGPRTAAQGEGHEPVITRKTKQNRKRNAKRNAKKKKNDTKDNRESEDDKLSAIAKILSQNNTVVNDQATEQDDRAGKDSEESQYGILQSTKEVLSKQSFADDAQATQERIVEKKYDEDSEKAKFQAIVMVLGQESAKDQGKKQGQKPVPDGNMTKHGQPHGESKPKNKAKNPSPEPSQEKGTTMSKESAQKSRISLDIVCGGPCDPCAKTTSKILARISELESKRKTLLADYGDTNAADRPNDANMMARIKKKAKAHGKPKGGLPGDDEEDDPVMSRLAQIKEQVKVIDQIIETSKVELEISQLKCNARRLDTYIHEEQVKFLHIHAATPHWIIPKKYKEHKEVMEDLREEAEKYRTEAEEVQGKATKAHDGPCPWGQPVSGYLLYAVLVVLVLCLVASFLGH